MKGRCGPRVARHLLLTTIAAGVLVSATCSSPTEESAPPAIDPSALSILFVGNSLTYSNDMREMVQALLEEADVGPIVVRSVSRPGYGLQDHWVDARTRNAIALGNWDYVVLQQGPSATEGRPSLLAFTRRFDIEIRAAGGRTALYMVWPSAARAFDFDGVAESNALAAKSVDGLLFPAGDAWRATWRADPDQPLYGPDGFHPSVLGSYSAALTIADRLVGASLKPSHRIRTSSIEVSIGRATGDLLLESAREANTRYAPTKHHRPI